MINTFTDDTSRLQLASSVCRVRYRYRVNLKSKKENQWKRQFLIVEFLKFKKNRHIFLLIFFFMLIKKQRVAKTLRSVLRANRPSQNVLLLPHTTIPLPPLPLLLQLIPQPHIIIMVITIYVLFNVIRPIFVFVYRKSDANDIYKCVYNSRRTR